MSWLEATALAKLMEVAASDVAVAVGTEQFFVTIVGLGFKKISTDSRVTFVELAFSFSFNGAAKWAFECFSFCYVAMYCSVTTPFPFVVVFNMHGPSLALWFFCSLGSLACPG